MDLITLSSEIGERMMEDHQGSLLAHVLILLCLPTDLLALVEGHWGAQVGYQGHSSRGQPCGENRALITSSRRRMICKKRENSKLSPHASWQTKSSL